MPMTPLMLAELESLFSEPAIAYGLKLAVRTDPRHIAWAEKNPEQAARNDFAVVSYNAAQFDATKAGKREEFDREMRLISSGRAAA